MSIFQTELDNVLIEKAMKEYHQIAIPEQFSTNRWRWVKDQYVFTNLYDILFVECTNQLTMTVNWGNTLSQTRVFEPDDVRVVVFVYIDGKWYGAPSFRRGDHNIEGLRQWIIQYRPRFIDKADLFGRPPGQDRVFIFCDEDFGYTTPWEYNRDGEIYKDWKFCSKLILNTKKPLTPADITHIFKALAVTTSHVVVNNFVFADEKLDIDVQQLDLVCGSQAEVERTSLNRRIFRPGEIRLYFQNLSQKEKHIIIR